MSLPRNFFFLLITFCYCSATLPKGTGNDMESVKFFFYSEEIELLVPHEIKTVSPGSNNIQNLTDFYNQLDATAHQNFIQTIRHYQTTFGLNDWLTYELIAKTSDAILKGRSDRHKQLLNWFLLSKMGYETRLAYLSNRLFVYVKTEEDVFETPLIEDNGQLFVGLTEIQYQKTNYNKSIHVLPFNPVEQGESFSFSLKKLPRLQPTTQNRVLQFIWRNQQIEIPVEYDQTLVEIMKRYPVVSEVSYLTTPLSSTLANSLLPQLRELLKDKNTVQKLEIIASFTRSAFYYKQDEAYFKRSKPMISEEVFFYPYSDCEDRSALFFGLVNELLDLPMLVVAFPEHLTIAVALDQPIGVPIRYNGRHYYICDPTGPSNSSEIGNAPAEFRQQSFEILYAHK